MVAERSEISITPPLQGKRGGRKEEEAEEEAGGRGAGGGGVEGARRPYTKVLHDLKF